MKRFITTLIIFLLYLTFSTVSFAEEPIKLIVNGKLIKSNISPQITKGQILVPVKELSEALEVPIVTWDEKSKIVYVGLDAADAINSKRISITGSSDFIKNIDLAMSLLHKYCPEEYSLISKYVTNIKDNEILSHPGTIGQTNPTGFISIDWNNLTKHFSYFRFDESQKPLHLAGVLVHEAYHIYHFKNNLIGYNKLSLLESEVLARTNQRKILADLGACKTIINTIDINTVIDTNYFGTFEE